jgi:hypothetical protein
MKKLLILLTFLLAFTFANAQNPVTITQPYRFLKYVQAKDSLHVYGVLFMNLHDTASTMAYARLQRNGLIQIKDSGTIFLTPHQTNILLNGKVNIADSLTEYVTHYQLTNFQGQVYEIEVSIPGTVTYTVPFTLKPTSQIYCNGTLLKNSLWSGNGTTSITLSIDAKQNDLIKIQN